MSVGRFLLWCYLVAMLVSGCFVAGWCLREHWEDLKAELMAGLQRQSCKRGEKR